MKVKFLIIRFSSIGDIVLTSPVIRGIKQQVEGAEIHFVCKKEYADLMLFSPYISKVHVMDEHMSDLIQELQEENFDYVIDLNQNFRSNRIRRRLKAEAFVFNKLNWEKMLLIWFKVNRLPQKHIVDRYMETAEIFDVQNDGGGLDYFLPKESEFKIEELPRQFQNGYVAFVIGGTYFTKKLPAEKVSQICQHINHPVILLGGKDAFEEGEKVLSQSKGNVLNYAGKITLNQSVSLVRDSHLVLSNDTGLMHIAAAFRKKIFSFWGNTIPEFGMYPYLPHDASEIAEIKGLKCRPCSKLGHHKCPKKHFNCMHEIDTQNAIDWINRNY
jgi:ADP-heptose:LPS heptosyltransferase